jgi:hypothetical protein
VPQKFLLFINFVYFCNIFNNVVSHWVYIALNDWMLVNNNLEAVVAGFTAATRRLSGRTEEKSQKSVTTVSGVNFEPNTPLPFFEYVRNVTCSDNYLGVC